MTLDEALQVLGVAPGSSPEEIRRACSRRTRSWNPAADPGGLNRLRTAQDLLLGEPAPPPPLPPSFAAPAAAASELPPPLPGAYLQARRIPLLAIEPDQARGSTGGRLLILCSTGLLLFVVLWVWLSSFHAANEPPVETPTPRFAQPQPAAVSYNTAQEGLAEVCGTRRDDFCRLAVAILQATAQHTCSDAKAARERLPAPTRYWSDYERREALLVKLDEEIARCWKFWNP